MAVGKSNRIVVDLAEGDLKRRLYSQLAQDGLTLKEWFTAAVDRYLRDGRNEKVGGGSREGKNDERPEGG